jgi:hypothetical protein
MGSRLQQAMGPSRQSLESAAVSHGGLGGRQLTRRQSQLASCQTSTDGALATAGPTSSAGAAPGSVLAMPPPSSVCGAASNHPLGRLSQVSHLSSLSLLTEARLNEGRPEDQMMLNQAQIHELEQRVSCTATQLV